MRKCLNAVSAVVFLLASVSHSKAQDTGVRPATLKVVLLGTGAGPPMDLQRYGPSTLVEAGGERLLFDCGRDATLRMAQYGIRLGGVSKVLSLIFTPTMSLESRISF